jgi:Ca2+-binding EF-hand superfamily protein
MLLENSDGDTISVVQRPLQGDPDTQFFSLIDVDGDWNLSADELNQASARLAQADIDGDGAFFVGEIGRSDASRKYADVMLAVLLGRPQSGAAAERALRTHYADAEGRVSRPAFQFAPGLFDRLDADRDGELQPAELQRIVALPAQITLAIDHGAVDSNEPTRIRLLNTSSEMQGMAPEAARPGVSHHWWHGDGELVLDIGQRAPSRNFKLMALEQMARLDRNKNGYLEPAEVFLIGQFAAWDLNGDGMVPQKELETAFANEARISRSCIQIDVTRHAPPLWARLDSNRDQLISVRELRQVKDLLAKYDADGDGAVAGRELPFQFAIQIVPATPTSRLVTRGVTRVSRGAQRRSVGPLWFDRMDRNGDGDISPREFLGTPEQFDKMDADRDGLIDPKEATAAKPQ